jgi:hypothetical protein
MAMVLLAEIACGDFSGHYSVGREQKAWVLLAAPLESRHLTVGGSAPRHVLA